LTKWGILPVSTTNFGYDQGAFRTHIPSTPNKKPSKRSTDKQVSSALAQMVRQALPKSGTPESPSKNQNKNPKKRISPKTNERKNIEQAKTKKRYTMSHIPAKKEKVT